VLRLARSASSADNPVLRGTPEGKAMQFALRTTFFFCAVNPGRMSPADQTRILLFELQKHDGNENVARELIAEEAYFRDLGPTWCSYMLSLAPLVVPTLQMFELVIPSTDRRHRQNIGTLLTGAWLALYGEVPSQEAAEDWAVEYMRTVEHHAEDIERDNSVECLEHLFAHVVDHYPIGHWVAVALSNADPDDKQYYDAERVLRTYDMVVSKKAGERAVLIRNGAPNVDAVFRNTMWEGRGWEKALRALEGAFRVKNPVHFSGSGEKSRCIGIPAKYIPAPIETKGEDD
jgi:hypothetical protein